jgi:predicted DsbA family dithiol-disulfide isomerase
VPRSLKALQLAELGRDLGRHTAVHDRLMDAYWAEGANVGDPDVLRGLAQALELPPDDVERVLAGDEYVPRIEASTQQALKLGINGIPGWLLDERLLVLGAQPREVFEQAFAQLSGDA